MCGGCGRLNTKVGSRWNWLEKKIQSCVVSIQVSISIYLELIMVTFPAQQFPFLTSSPSVPFNVNVYDLNMFRLRCLCECVCVCYFRSHCAGGVQHSAQTPEDECGLRARRDL